MIHVVYLLVLEGFIKIFLDEISNIILLYLSRGLNLGLNINTFLNLSNFTIKLSLGMIEIMNQEGDLHLNLIQALTFTQHHIIGILLNPAHPKALLPIGEHAKLLLSDLNRLLHITPLIDDNNIVLPPALLLQDDKRVPIAGKLFDQSQVLIQVLEADLLSPQVAFLVLERLQDGGILLGQDGCEEGRVGELLGVELVDGGEPELLQVLVFAGLGLQVGKSRGVGLGDGGSVGGWGMVGLLLAGLKLEPGFSVYSGFFYLLALLRV